MELRMVDLEDRIDLMSYSRTFKNEVLTKPAKLRLLILSF